MGRSRKYVNAAERQRAYRERLAAQQPNDLGTLHQRSRGPSRPARLAKVQLAVQDLHDEYEQWLECLPASLEDSRQAQLLSETVEQLEGVLDLLSEVHLPLGFGRD